MKKNPRHFVLTIMLVMLTACQHSPTTTKTVNSRAAIGAVLISVTSAAPWGQVADAMHPNFTMKNGDVAISKVAPRTARIQEQTLDALGFTLGLGLPQSFTDVLARRTETTSETSSTASGATVTTADTSSAASKEKTETKTKGEVPEAPSGIPAGGTLPGGEAPDLDPGVDPMLQYQAARTLYQYVQLLNREAKHAALRKDYVPYIATMKIGFMPYQRDLPYDLHAQISFFKGRTDHTPVKEVGGRQPEVPYVMPILVTDNLERAIKSQAAAVARQIGLALNFMVQGVGGNVGFNKANQNLSAILADDVNSLLTVSRLTDNTLYARIGAANQATERYGIVGRNYEVALLLLVPKNYFPAAENPKISVVTHTEFRHAQAGNLLPMRGSEHVLTEIDAAFIDVLSGYGSSFLEKWESLDTETKLKLGKKMIGLIQQSKYSEFIEYSKDTISNKTGLPRDRISDGYLRALWVELASVTAESSFNSASVELPKIQARKIPEQTVLLRDDEKTKAEVVLRNVSGITPSNTQAHLRLAANTKHHDLPAQTVTVDKIAGTVTYVFPSPAKWKMAPIDYNMSRLVLNPIPCPFANACQQDELKTEFMILAMPVKPKEPKPGFKLRTGLKEVIMGKDHSDIVTIHIDKLSDPKVILTVSGARLADATNEAGEKITIEHARVILKKGAGNKPENKTVLLTLGSLKANRSVIVKAEGMKPDPKNEVNDVKTGELTLVFSVSKGS